MTGLASLRGNEGEAALSQPRHVRGAAKVDPIPGRRASACIAFLVLLTGCGQSEFRFIDLWLTADQQGQRAFDQGDYAEAARQFEDPLWKGTAYYLDQDFDSALGEFAKVDTAQGWFDRGNALAHLERYEEAMDAYRKAVELQPDFPRAAANLKYLEPFLPLQFEGGEMGTVGRDAAADDIVFDANQDRLDEEGIDTVMEGEQQMVSDAQLAEMWLRQVDTSPTSFLRYKFAYQAQMGDLPAETSGTGGDEAATLEGER
jgi:Ca-activated chloride channel family protein